MTLLCHMPATVHTLTLTLSLPPSLPPSLSQVWCSWKQSTRVRENRRSSQFPVCERVSGSSASYDHSNFSLAIDERSSSSVSALSRPGILITPSIPPQIPPLYRSDTPSDTPSDTLKKIPL